MSKVLIDTATLSGIANAIRSKRGIGSPLSPQIMAQEIAAIGSSSAIASVDTSMLPESADILLSLCFHDASTVPDGLGITAEWRYGAAYKGATLGYGDCLEYNLGSVNRSHTVYLLSKYWMNESREAMIVSTPYAQSTGNGPGWFCNARSIIWTNWGSYAQAATNDDRYHLYAYSCDCDSAQKKVDFYFDGVKKTTINFNNAGQKVIVNRHLASAYDRNNFQNIGYWGITDGYEAEADVVANCQHIMTAYGGWMA